MNYKNLIIICCILLFSGCNQHISNEKTINHKSFSKYKNSGFALVYEKELNRDNKISKKIDISSSLEDNPGVKSSKKVFDFLLKVKKL